MRLNAGKIAAFVKFEDEKLRIQCVLLKNFTRKDQVQ
jgi:hypothetical protein